MSILTRELCDRIFTNGKVGVVFNVLSTKIENNVLKIDKVLASILRKESLK